MADPLERQPDRPGIQGIAADFIAPNWARRFLHVLDVGWATWRRTHWELSSDAKADALESIDLYCAQQADANEEAGNGVEAKSWRSIRTAGHRRGILDNLSTRRALRASQDALDPDPDLLACSNCVINLRTGMPQPAEPRQLITKHSPARYDPLVPLEPEAKEIWAKALQALPVDAREWFQLQIGQSFIGRGGKYTYVLTGKGNNGKSALMTAITDVAGTYGDALSNDVLLKQAARGPAPELMTLKGLRFGLIEETPEEGRLNTKRLKDLTDTAKIRTRQLYGQEITFAVTHTLFVNTNYLPIVDETDDGTWRRLRAIPFNIKYVPRDQVTESHHQIADLSIKDRLRDPDVHAVILAWIVEGAKRAYRTIEEPPLPPSVQAKTEEWRAESDVAFGFAQEFLAAQEDSLIPGVELIKAMNKYLMDHGKAKWSSTLMNKRLPDSLVLAGLPRTESAVIKVRKTDQISMFEGAARDHEVIRGWRGLAFKHQTAPWRTA